MKIQLCSVCKKNKVSGKDKWCTGCKSFLKGLSGRDVNREKVRIRRRHICARCKRKWNGKERRFDIHHLFGECGVKSRGYDALKNTNRLRVYCHRCHCKIHKKGTGGKGVMKGHGLLILKLIDLGFSRDAVGALFSVKSSAICKFIKEHIQFDEDTLKPSEY